MRTMSYLIGLVLIFVSCKKESNQVNQFGAELQIEMGSICGWCVEGDRMIINSAEIAYSFITPCDDLDYSKHLSTEVKEWNNLRSLLNKGNFSSIQINTCHVCADGCDQWIEIKDGSYKHKITFGWQDTQAIKLINPFVLELDKIRQSLKN